MALDPQVEAALALHRFGLGPRPGSLNAIASDPRGALLADLERSGAARITRDGLLTSGEAARTAFNFQQALRAARQAQREPAQRSIGEPADGTGQATAPAGPTAAPETATPSPQPARPQPNPTGLPSPQQIYLDEAKARLD